ncbi:transport protein TonB [Chitinispirillum alkaliphilum]|nr:transport protein TonB [Chitinispirillum alkaliphilum]
MVLKNYLKIQGIKITCMAVALSASFLLFSVLPFTRTLIDIDSERKADAPRSVPVVMQRIVEQRELSDQPMRQVREMQNPASNVRSSRNLGFSMRFTPDLGVGGSGGGVGFGHEDLGSVVFDEGDVDEHPRPVSRPAIVYPRRAKDLGIEGTVSVIMVVDREGRVKDVTVESSPHILLTRAVEQSVRRWRFEPARYQGVPVQVRTRQELSFRLDQ